MIDVAIPANSDIRKKEHEKIKKVPGVGRTTEGAAESKVQSGPRGTRSFWSFDPQTERVARSNPAEPANSQASSRESKLEERTHVYTTPTRGKRGEITIHRYDRK